MSFTFDLSDFQRAAKAMNALADQIPFALSRAMNASAEVARKELIDTTWAQHITVRNPSFLKSALTLRGARASKSNLRVEIYDQLGRNYLLLHDTGGRRTPRSGGALAIPDKTNLQPRRGAHGIPKNLKPRALANSFVKESVYGKVLFQRTGKYVKGKKATKRSPVRPGHDGRGLKAMYGLAPSNVIKPDVPFHRDFELIVRRELPRQFSTSMQAAMKTAFRK